MDYSVSDLKPKTNEIHTYDFHDESSLAKINEDEPGMPLTMTRRRFFPPEFLDVYM
jgi:hypothetical protein